MLSDQKSVEIPRAGFSSIEKTGGSGEGRKALKRLLESSARGSKRNNLICTTNGELYNTRNGKLATKLHDELSMERGEK